MNIGLQMGEELCATGEVQLHCFTDASESAYGACIYARTEKANGEVKVVLLAAKSRVAPLQRRSIPRLELCAAQLGARLSTRVVDTLDLKSTPIYYWTDSMVVIYWLRAPSQTWKTFVANRVADIHILTKNASWQHVPGVNNPADVVSRGLTVHQLLNCKLWTDGPDWLGRGDENWPKLEIPRTTNIDGDTERKTTTLLIQNPPPPHPLFTRSFSYNRLLRTTAYCLRVSRKARKELIESTLILTPTELESARDCLVKLVQTECYHTELSFLRKGKPVPKKSALRLLNPFVDASGIIRVGGRLKLSLETFSTKHQILLPGFHRFTRMLLLLFHNKLVHGGIALTLGVVRNEYWPTNGRRAVRSVIRTCFRCTRANPKPLKQPIGQIPLARVTPSRPFASTRIDYCGPVFVKSPNRKSAPTKAYIALFVCFSTKAVHIELVGDLSTASFLSALQRFVARRGKPQYIYSDNATNFVGARNELHALYEMFSSPKETDRIATALTTEGIQPTERLPRIEFFPGEVQLHCFTDASESAYGACIYARTEKANGEVKVVLLAAKSRVAPLQRRSIPRLELCAAQLGARLSTRVVDTLDLKSTPIYYWTDSMVVIYWLRAPSQTWKTFVANRVADIHILTKNAS
ncbi:uncharacterized protein LOC129759956 [Uranotaenia lowii]|uniref:uncharacterized protein LOC129759956 n=1 Tax=Uranotaenia lowii TaxID=190385 RepID=UPI002479575C|nr:uncharacterized protein LOC129759956 [Uranotaenia lowii]